MNYLLDTHTIIWSADDPGQLSPLATSLIQDKANRRFISAATIWELSIKCGQKKITLSLLSLPYKIWITKAISDLKLTILSVTVDYSDRQANLPNHHKDPFDRMMIAQALEDDITVIGNDVIFDLYGVKRIW